MQTPSGAWRDLLTTQMAVVMNCLKRYLLTVSRIVRYCQCYKLACVGPFLLFFFDRFGLNSAENLRICTREALDSGIRGEYKFAGLDIFDKSRQLTLKWVGGNNLTSSRLGSTDLIPSNNKIPGTKMTEQTVTHAPFDSGVPPSARCFSVEGLVVLITGAGQGIGREVARQFAAAGAIAVVADLNVEKAESVVGEIQAAGGKGLAVRVDVGDKASVDAMVAKVIQSYGRVDVLINNASIFAAIEKRPFDQIPLEQWELVMRVNVTGTFLCVQAVAQAMRDAQFGRVINISSDAVPRGTVNYLHYVTSKSAIIGMTNSLARALGAHGVTVNCIRPGMVATEVERTVNPTLELRERTANMQCIPRGMMPTDMVGILMFLATPAAAFITGQTIACDGGYTHSS